ncbi:MAG: glycerophosphodiester phosphodiesterase [Nakamurella sp.]
MTRYLDPAAPRGLAHRGWHLGEMAGLENSMAAFRRAVDEGFHYLETDVHATADGVAVAFHDVRLDRVTTGRGAIAAHTLAQLSDVLIGGREPIPTLVEVLEAFPDTFLNVDPKSDAVTGPLLDALLATGAHDRVCIGSFSGRRLTSLRSILGPTVATSLAPSEVLRLLRAPRLFDRARLPEAGVVAAQVPVSARGVPLVTRRFIESAHARSIEVHVWTVNEATEMRRLLDLGVDGIITDRPDVLRSVYRERGLWR